MLQRIRDNASGPIAYVVVGLIALVFGVWGIGSYFTPSSDPVVASVGDTDITQSQLRQGFNQRYQRLRQVMGKNFNPDLVPPDQLRRSVLQGMINDAVLQQYARAADYRVTDADVLAQLRSNPQFQENGRFSPQRYRALLAQANIAPARYEASLRQGLRNQAVQEIVTGSAFAAPAEVSQAYRLVNQERRVRYLLFDPARYRDQVKIGDDEIPAYYESHPKAFIRPQRVKLAYVSLDRANAAGDNAASEQTLRTLYDKNKATLGTPEKRSAEEIRVPIDPKDPGAARAAIQQVAQQIGGDSGAKHGNDFKRIAQSIDAARYGRIDAATRDRLPDAVGAALFGLKNGQTSTPVKGDDAWYVLRQTGSTPAKTPAFKDPKIQAQLKAIASAQHAAQAYRDKSERMDNLAYQAPNDLQTLSNKLGLNIQHSGWIDRDGGPGIGQYDAIRSAAFSDSVLKDKLNSTVIALGGDRRVVLRVAAVQPAKRKPLDAVKDTIRQRLIARKANIRARDVAENILKTLRGGRSDMQAAATAHPGVALRSPGYIKRANERVDPRIVETVFSMPAPAHSKPDYRITSTADGGVALVAINQVRDGSESANDSKPSAGQQAGREQFARRQRNYIAGLEFASLSDYLRANADVTIDRDQIQ